MNNQTSTPLPRTGKFLTRDQCVEIRALRRHRVSLQKIAEEVGVSYRQVQYACARSDENPRSRSGRPPILDTEQQNQLVDYIRSSAVARRMTYLELAVGPFCHWNCGEGTIRRALTRRGYRRYQARIKPVLSEQNRAKRLRFAQDHVDWTPEQWGRVLWTDETWATGACHKRSWVTRRVSIYINYILI